MRDRIIADSPEDSTEASATGSADHAYAEAILEAVPQPLLVLDSGLRVESANPAFCRQFGGTREENLGRLVYRLGGGRWDIPELRRLLEEVQGRQGAVEDCRLAHTFEGLGERTLLLTARRLGGEEGSERIVLAISDVTERERLLFELAGSRELADKLIDSVRESLLVLDRDLRVQTANESFFEQFKTTRKETVGRHVYELGDGQWDLPELRALLEEILPKESSFDDFEMDREFQNIGRRVVLLNARRLDHLNLILLAIRDVTEQRRQETRRQAFMGELQHRVKNILGNVRALASQTRRNSGNLDEFFQAFDARLASLGRVQDLLVRSPSEAVALEELVELELEAIGAEKGSDFTVEGPTVRLSPRDAQAMAMTVHELTTNAAKYGALSTEAGRIEIGWSIELREGRQVLSFHWQEHGVAITDGAPTKGFGSRLIEESLPRMLGGSAVLTYEAHGASCRLEFPLPS